MIASVRDNDVRVDVCMFVSSAHCTEQSNYYYYVCTSVYDVLTHTVASPYQQSLTHSHVTPSVLGLVL